MMRLCASLGTPHIEGTEDADIIEVRTDVFDSVPDIDKEMIITLTDPQHRGMVPDGYRGMLDIGISDISKNGAILISSYHDPDGVPKDAFDILMDMKGDIVKGAFSTRDLKDLMDIFHISRKLERKHVLIGMGELGKVTRIRQNILGNEFTFCHTGTPTAPGQMSLGEMRSLGDDCVITGLIGHGISDTSARMHDAAFRECGIRGKYLMFDVPGIDGIEEVIRAYEIRGINVTHPFKTSVIDQLDSLDQMAEKVGSVNTIHNDDGVLKGYNTDIIGIETAMDVAGVDLSGRVLIIGSGGAARSCAFVMTNAGCDVTVMSRNAKTATSLARDLGCRTIPMGSAALRMYDVVVNCTPETDLRIGLGSLTKEQAVFDMIHSQDTSLIRIGRERGCRIIDAKDMLAAQGAASFELWNDVDRTFDIMRDAI